MNLRYFLLCNFCNKADLEIKEAAGLTIFQLKYILHGYKIFLNGKTIL